MNGMKDSVAAERQFEAFNYIRTCFAFALYTLLTSVEIYVFVVNICLHHFNAWCPETGVLQ